MCSHESAISLRV